MITLLKAIADLLLHWTGAIVDVIVCCSGRVCVSIKMVVLMLRVVTVVFLMFQVRGKSAVATGPT